MENELQYIKQCPHADAGQLAAMMYIKGELWKELKIKRPDQSPCNSKLIFMFSTVF